MRRKKKGRAGRHRDLQRRRRILCFLEVGEKKRRYSGYIQEKKEGGEQDYL